MNNWIDSNKELPDTINEFNESEMVLIFYGDTIEIGYYDSDDEWWRNDNGVVLYNIVSYWMPLPKKPI